MYCFKKEKAHVAPFLFSVPNSSGYSSLRRSSRFLGKSKEAFDKNPQLSNLLLDDFFSKVLNDYHPSWRRGIIQAIQNGVPTPAFSTALAFYDGYRTARLPANLLQAQRDYFGAHTYERIDKPRGQFFHTNLTGRGGRTASGSYNV